jgi:Protein of unknown function (DUF3015)
MHMTKRQKGIFVLAVALLGMNSEALAQNVGRCGWGSKLFEGNDGIAPQVLAVTTNGFLGNQTFGITSGTSGCTQSGVVRSNWKSVLFIEQNKSLLARDIATGDGETLVAFADVIGVEQQDKAHFFAQSQSNFGQLFPSEKVTAGEVAEALKTMLEKDGQLKKYAAAV